MEGEGKRPKSEPEELETLPKVLTDFGELERLPANARVVLLSHMSDIRQLIEFGRSNVGRRRFLKRHRVFPMWFKRQCGFPEDMSDQEANMRIMSFLIRLELDSWLVWENKASVGIEQNHWAWWNIYVTVDPAFAEVLTKLQEHLPETPVSRSWSETKIGRVFGKLTTICYSNAVHPVFDMFRIVEFLNTTLPASELSLKADDTFSCADPFDIMAFIIFFDMKSVLHDRSDGTHDNVTEYRRAKASYKKLCAYPFNLYVSPLYLYKVVQSRLLEGKIKLSDL